MSNIRTFIGKPIEDLDIVELRDVVNFLWDECEAERKSHHQTLGILHSCTAAMRNRLTNDTPANATKNGAKT